MQIAIAKRPFLNGPHCGDASAYWVHDGKLILCIVDGLGHGEGAEEAANAATEYVAEHLSEPLPALFAGCDAALRHTRGAAMGIAIVDMQAGTLEYAGVGNTRARIIKMPTKTSRSLGNSFGIVGGGFRTLVPESVPLDIGDLVLMYTDGVKEMFDLSSYGNLRAADVHTLAQRILHDWGRTTDDAAVLVFRHVPPDA